MSAVLGDNLRCSIILYWYDFIVYDVLMLYENTPYYVFIARIAKTDMM